MFNQVPEVLAKVLSLKVILFNHNRIATVPKLFDELPFLEIVHMHGNPVREIACSIKFSEFTLDVFEKL